MSTKKKKVEQARLVDVSTGFVYNVNFYPIGAWVDFSTPGVSGLDKTLTISRQDPLLILDSFGRDDTLCITPR